MIYAELLQKLEDILKSKDSEIRKLQAQLMTGGADGLFIPALKLGDPIFYLNDWNNLEVLIFEITEIRVKDGEWHFYRDPDYRVASFYRDSGSCAHGYFVTKKAAEEALERRRNQNDEEKKRRKLEDIEKAKKILQEAEDEIEMINITKP